MAQEEKPLVLVADDDPIMRQLHTKLCEDLARIVTVTNTFDAEEKMRMLRPKLVLLDDIMPHCPTGLTLLEKVKKDETLSDIPIIMVTASNKKEEIERGLQAGAAAYITKPVNPEVLRKAILDSLLARPKRVLIAMRDVSFGAELAAFFTAMKCQTECVDHVDALRKKLADAPDLLLLADLDGAAYARAAFDAIRQSALCPVLLIGAREEEGAGLVPPSYFMMPPLDVRAVALQAARLMRENAKPRSS
jgi:CheY-like chemotaxis protein